MISLMTWWTTETADPPLWKHNHIKAFSTSPQRAAPCLHSEANNPGNCHIYRRFLQKTLTFGTESFLPPLLCEFTAFQRAHNGLLGKHYNRVRGRRLFRWCGVSSLHVPLLDVNNCIGQLQSLPSVNGKQLECSAELAVAKWSPVVFFSTHDYSPKAHLAIGFLSDSTFSLVCWGKVLLSSGTHNK